MFEHDKNWVFLCQHVTKGERPVRVVVHEKDDDWQVLCGENDHDSIGWRAELIGGAWEIGFDA